MVDLGHGRGWLNASAAASIFRIDRQIGHPLQITEAGRTWAQQNEHYQRYLRDGYPIALSPDTPSVHQEGEAIDSDEAQTIPALMDANGWLLTVFRNGKLIEPWHREYFIEHDQHLYDPAPKPRTEEDEMTISYINIKGKAGARRGGCFAVMRDNNGALFARFVEGKPLPSAPTMDDESAIAAMQASIPGLG